MIEQGRKVFIITVVLIILFGVWMFDRYNLVRTIKEERWRSKEESVEKEARLKMMEEKMRAGQKEREKLYLEEENKIREEMPLKQKEALPEAQPEQILLDKEYDETQRIEKEKLNQEVQSAQEEAVEKELVEMERLFRERERGREEATVGAQ